MSDSVKTNLLNILDMMSKIFFKPKQQQILIVSMYLILLFNTSI
jgi:hypothetical protein